MKKIGVLVLFWGLIFSTLAFAGENGFTREDRERLIRLEATLQTFMRQVDKRFEQIDKRFEDVNRRFEDINSRFEDMNKRFEQMDKRISELREDTDRRFEDLTRFLWILAGIFTALTAAVIALVIWDRRSTVKYALKEADERYALNLLPRILEVLKEKAKTDQELATILRNYGLL